jgi:hypothetical protein
MKMRPEHFALLKSECEAVLRARPTMRQSYLDKGRSLQRLRWDVVGAIRIDGDTGIKWVCDTLYPYLNDDHINTALKAIIKEQP